MYTIYKENSSIILTDNLNNKEADNFYFFKEVDIKEILIRMENHVLNIILYHPDINSLWKSFAANFKIIEAAGGLIQNDSSDVLFIFRDHKWDLPKGKIENNESIQDAARREVQEECGIDKVVIKDFIMKTYHIYTYKKQEILKISHWYFMTSNEKKLKPQLEEGISKVVWKNKKQIEEAIKNTYPNIKMLLESIKN